MGFVDRMDQNSAKYRKMKWKNDCSPCSLEWSMLLYRMRGCCIVLTKMKAMSLSLLAFWRNIVNVTFLKYSKEGRSFSSHAGIWNAPSDVCDDDTKHYMVPSKKQGRCKVWKKEYPRPLRTMSSISMCQVNQHDICLEIFHGY